MFSKFKFSDKGENNDRLKVNWATILIIIHITIK